MRKTLVVASLCLAALACGGSGSSSSSNPDTATSSVTLAASSSTVDLPAVGSYTEKLTLPPATPVGAALGVTITTQTPGGLPALASLDGGIAEAWAPHRLAAAAPTPIAFLQLANTTGAAEVFGAYPGFSIATTGTAFSAGGTYRVEVYHSTASSLGWAVIGDAVLVAPTLTFTGPQGTFTVAAGETVTLAMVAIQSAASGVVTLSPATTSATPYALAPGGNVTLTAVESGYSGTFTAQSSASAMATVSPGSSAGAFTVTGVAPGTAQITVTDGASHSKVFYVAVSSATGTLVVHLPEQQGIAVALPSVAGSNVAGGNLTFATAPAGTPYPAGTLVTVAITNGVPAGFGFSPSNQVFGITFTSNNTITTATMATLPKLNVTLAAAPAGSIGALEGEVLLPLAPFASCSITGSGTSWSIAGQAAVQGLTAGTPSGYDFYGGNTICLP